MFEYRQATPFRQDIDADRTSRSTRRTPGASRRSITLNYGVRWEPWFPQDSKDQAFYSFDIGRLRAGDAQQGVPECASRTPLSRRCGIPGHDRHEDRMVEHRAARRRFVGSRRATAAPSMRAGYGHDRRLRHRPVLLRLALGSAVRSRAASHRGAPRRSVGLGGQNESVPGRSSSGANYPFSRPLYVTVHHGAVRHQDHAQPQLERRAAAPGRRQHGGVGDLPRQPHGQHVGRGRRQPGARPRAA